jgi:hypothetical protein
MDLNIDRTLSQPAGAGLAAPRSTPRWRNDAFSFWKLPESWRSGMHALIEESEQHARHYLFEEYLEDHRRRPSRLLSCYYTVKDLIPAALRHRLNSLAINSRPRPSFPDWPCEDALLQVWRRSLAALLDECGAQDSWHLGFWPGDHKVCIVLTHDVESPLGLARMERMADLVTASVRHGTCRSTSIRSIGVSSSGCARGALNLARMVLSTMGACSAAIGISPNSRRGS